MKRFVRMLFILYLLLISASCALLTKGRVKPKAGWKTTSIIEEGSSRRQIGELAEEKKDADSQRRSLNKSGIEKVSMTGRKEDQTETQKSVAIFEPFDPEKQAKEEIIPEGEERLPEEITKELLGETPEEEYVTLNFEQAPIEDILNSVSEILGINFIMTPGVKGAITMQTSKPVPALELFQILQSVLEVNGLTLVPSGRYYKVVFGKEAKQYPIKVLSGKEGEELPFEDSFITQIIPLDYIPVKDMANIIQPFLSKSAPVMIQHEELNILIINDLASNMKRLLRFVQELDKPLYQPKEKVYVYYVENGDAEKLAATLNSIYKGVDKSKFPFTAPTREGGGVQPQQPQPQQVIQTPFGPYFPSQEVTGEVRITADKEINALIIVTAPRDYPAVLETIKKLDIMPRQVLIEAMIVDVTLTDRTEFGLGWFLKGNLQSVGANFGNLPLSNQVSGYKDFDSWFRTIPKVDYGSISDYLDVYNNLQRSDAMMGPEGVTDMFGYNLITNSGNFMAFMKMISEFTEFNVVSSPYIMAVDNQKAIINITRQYPIPTVREVAAGATGTEFQRTYDYKDVGLKLEVTPKINESRMVNLELTQEVSEFAEEYKDTGQGIYNKRETTSRVVIKDGQTIVIGGLIQKSKSKSRSGIPFLSDIPLMGRLFGGTKDVIQKTELLIFITPHVVSTEEEIEKLTTELENKLDSLKELSAEFKKTQN